jgi:hypothetical protein
MSSVETNLRILKPSRKAPMAGDIFVLRPNSLPFFFGRVVRTDASTGSIVGILAYIYKTSSPKPLPVPPLHRDDLLIPPFIINRLPWSRGYFEIVDRRALTAWDTLPIHCFRDVLTGGYYDELGRRLPSPTPPVGIRGLHSFRTIDDLVSDALGIPKVPD